MTARPYLDGPHPRILAHRGLATAAPENSVAAFEAALAAGATHLECDVRATADGQAVFVHDPDLPDGTAVASLPLAALQQRLPGVATVTEALTALPDARFNVDVKSADAAQPFAAAVRAVRAVPRVLVTSFSGRRRAAALALLPGVATSASGDRMLLAIAGLRTRQQGLVALALRGVDAVQIPERAAGTDLAAPWTIRAFQRAGVEVHFWVVNDAARMRELVAHGADGIVTDRADVARDALR